MQRTDINIFILFRFYLDLIHRQENYHLFHLVNFNSLCNLPYLNDLWNSHNFNYGNYGTCKFYEKKKKYHISVVRSILTNNYGNKDCHCHQFILTHPRPRDFRPLRDIDSPTKEIAILIFRRYDKNYFSFTCREYSRRILTLA